MLAILGIFFIALGVSVFIEDENQKKRWKRWIYRRRK